MKSFLVRVGLALSLLFQSCTSQMRFTRSNASDLRKTTESSDPHLLSRDEISKRIALALLLYAAASDTKTRNAGKDDASNFFIKLFALALITSCDISPASGEAILTAVAPSFKIARRMQDNKKLRSGNVVADAQPNGSPATPQPSPTPHVQTTATRGGGRVATNDSEEERKRQSNMLALALGAAVLAAGDDFGSDNEVNKERELRLRLYRNAEEVSRVQGEYGGPMNRYPDLQSKDERIKSASALPLKHWRSLPSEDRIRYVKLAYERLSNSAYKLNSDDVYKVREALDKLASDPNLTLSPRDLH